MKLINPLPVAENIILKHGHFNNSNTSSILMCDWICKKGMSNLYTNFDDFYLQIGKCYWLEMWPEVTNNIAQWMVKNSCLQEV